MKQKFILIILFIFYLNIYFLFSQNESLNIRKNIILSSDFLFNSLKKDSIQKPQSDETFPQIKDETLLPVSIHSQQTFSEDELLKFSDEECKFCKVDRLDSLLQTWYYYSGRDTINFIQPNERNNINGILPDSVYEERLRKIISPIELSYNKIVQKFLDQYVKNGKWTAPKLLGLSYRYFPIFEQKLDAYNMPIELKYLAVIESALNPIAKSSSGASGLWQFMFQTGKGFGLEINSFVDERMDIEKSTETACKYLKKLKETYNDWILAIAAYNCGPGTVNNAIRRAGGKTNYWEIYPYLPYETRNYVPRFIAVTYLFECGFEHGYKPEPFSFYTDIDIVMVRKELHFAQLDSVLGISIEQSRELNPQYKMDIIPAKAKPYPLRLRHQYVAKFIELEDSIYAFKDSVFFNPQKYNYKPNEHYDEDFPTAAQPEGTTELKYTVKSGDVIGLIASWYDVRNNELKAWNGIGNTIRVGDVLKVYIPNDKVNKYKNINTMSFEEKQKSVGVDASTNKVIETPLDPNYEYYIIKSGDSPYSIATRYEVSLDELLQINNITNPSSLKIGQKIKLRKK
ncbi:MAG: transglycosylase SLT domain-containing protein [Bacteroidales bacterium]|jgi:membrane-bound lytic murein transglycosylase D|nr:transglycosylase SLT domain-containing protein [Bacteroidales bacterium]